MVEMRRIRHKRTQESVGEAKIVTTWAGFTRQTQGLETQETRILAQ